MVLSAALLALACSGGAKTPASTTPTLVASTPVGASPTATTVLPAATVGPSPTPTTVLPTATVDPHRDVDALLANAGDEVATWLRSQPWLYDGSGGSLEAVKSITGAAFDPDPVKAKAKQDEVMTLLHGLDQSTWYDGHPSDADKAAIAAVFDEAVNLPREAATRISRTGQLQEPALQKYDWQRELLDVLTQRHFATVAGASEQVTLLVASPDDDSKAVDVLNDASGNLHAIEGLAGAITSPRLLFILDPDLDPSLCGLAIPEDYLILLQPNKGCLQPDVVIHEMTHIAMRGGSSGIWLSGGLSGPRSVCPD